MTFIELAERVLSEEKRPLTANEIWMLATEKGYDKLLRTSGKTPGATLAARLYVDVRDNPNSPFARIAERPKKFYLKSQAGKINLTDTESPPETTIIRKKQFNYLEKDLHPFLTYYAYYYLRCYTKSIHHSQSSKKEYGEWIHPDMVGCYFPLDDWKDEVYELCSAIGTIPIRLFSFELKRELHFGNLRESFFQTVSNSSWANESYLVAAAISEEEEFRKELSRLSASFGIGIIELNLEDPDSSLILFPARYREVPDWETINKLMMNPDFQEFISTVKIDITSKKIHKKEYNSIPDPETLRHVISIQ